MKRYTLFRYPSLNGSPVEFDSFALMWLYATWHVICGSLCTYEYHDNDTGEYRSYWK